MRTVALSVGQRQVKSARSFDQRKRDNILSTLGVTTSSTKQDRPCRHCAYDHRHGDGACAWCGSRN